MMLLMCCNSFDGRSSFFCPSAWARKGAPQSRYRPVDPDASQEAPSMPESQPDPDWKPAPPSARLGVPTWASLLDHSDPWTALDDTELRTRTVFLVPLDGPPTFEFRFIPHIEIILSPFIMYHHKWIGPNDLLPYRKLDCKFGCRKMLLDLHCPR